jgi:hypothetical protein
MTTSALRLQILPETLAVCRLDRDAAVPPWATGSFVSISRSGDELSVVCPEAVVPPDSRCERNWRCLRVAGTLHFSAVGVLASLLVPLAQAGISVFALSTFDTDYLLVKEAVLPQVIEVLLQAGHWIE